MMYKLSKNPLKLTATLSLFFQRKFWNLIKHIRNTFEKKNSKLVLQCIIAVA